MALTYTQMNSILSQYVLPAAVDRIMNRVHGIEFRLLRPGEEVANWLYEQVQKERGEVLEDLKCDIQEKAECPVCKTPVIVSQARRCSRCTTPHHKDCYEFSGACAIYGCGSRS